MPPTPPPPMNPAPERRRRRPAVSCALCRRRKLRCNRETPCSNCVRAKNEACVYESHASPLPRQPLAQASRDSVSIADRHSASMAPSRPTSSIVVVSTSPSTASNLASPPRQASAPHVEAMRARIRELEEQLSNAALKPVHSPVLTPPSSGIDDASASLGGSFYFHREGSLPNQPQAITRGVSHKTRLLGQSHWVNGVSPVSFMPSLPSSGSLPLEVNSKQLQDIIEVAVSHLRDESSDVYPGMHRCKSLAKAIKSRRAPPWPSPPSRDLPPREVADELVACYLRTTETVHRILHIPSFKRDYEALWTSNPALDLAFMVQVKLVLAIGATVYDEQFSLRTSAVRWVYEAQTWISEPEFKARLGIQYLQTNILLLLARELAAVGGDSVWVSAGALLRRAVSMGLHRDPAHLPKSTVFAAEMRRRLWNTILEIALQSSLTSGGPPLVSLRDFDTEPPSNLDDEHLISSNPVPKPETQFTQVSVANALRKTFPFRLAVTKFLNDLSSRGTYEETLRLDAELRGAYKALCRSLQGYSSNTGQSPSPFAMRAVDYLMNRHLSALHIPFFGLAALETAYAFSRKVVVETSFKLWCAAYPASAIIATPQPRGDGDIVASIQDDLARLIACGSGSYRTVAMQAALLIAIELRTELEEEQGLHPVLLRPDLLAVVEDAKAWCLHCVEIGETNVKGYVLMSLAAAQIKGLMARLGQKEIREALVKAMKDAEETCIPILEGLAAQGQIDSGVADPHPTSLSTPSVLEDWDTLMSDTLFNPESMGPMNWVFSDTPQQMALW